MKFFIKLMIMLGILQCGFSQATTTLESDVSLREKIGQMLIMGFEGKTITNDSSIVHDIQQHHIGGVILFDYNYQTKKFDKNIENPAQVLTLNTMLQEANAKAASTHQAALPLLISVDYEGGQVNRLKESYGFPKTAKASEVGLMSFDDANGLAHDMASTLTQHGFNLNFAPVLDVNVNPDNPIMGKLGRSFSDDPRHVADYANIYASHFLSQKVQCAYKHFPGHGSSTSDSHLGFVDVSDTWLSYELDPYRDLLNTETSCGMVMTAHIVNRQLDDSNLPATLSHKILTGMLREQLHFDGVIISDDMQMKAISEHYGLEQALTLAINAGVDMFIFGNQLSEKPQNVHEIVTIIEENVRAGKIAESRINDAYRHIVQLKQSLLHAK